MISLDFKKLCDIISLIRCKVFAPAVGKMGFIQFLLSVIVRAFFELEDSRPLGYFFKSELSDVFLRSFHKCESDVMRV